MLSELELYQNLLTSVDASRCHKQLKSQYFQRVVGVFPENCLMGDL